jgi:hypothetical protein
MKIVARKPAGLFGAPDAEYIIVDRGEKEADRYVSAFITSHSKTHGEWCSGYYFHSLGEAINHFNRRNKTD